MKRLIPLLLCGVLGACTSPAKQDAQTCPAQFAPEASGQAAATCPADSACAEDCATCPAPTGAEVIEEVAVPMESLEEVAVPMESVQEVSADLSSLPEVRYYVISDA